MKGKSYIRKRLERLEERQDGAPGSSAIIEMACLRAGEHHLDSLSEVGSTTRYFREAPGSGRQLGDFGKFMPVVYMTTAELEIPADECFCSTEEAATLYPQFCSTCPLHVIEPDEPTHESS